MSISDSCVQPSLSDEKYGGGLPTLKEPCMGQDKYETVETVSLRSAMSSPESLNRLRVRPGTAMMILNGRKMFDPTFRRMDPDCNSNIGEFIETLPPTSLKKLKRYLDTTQNITSFTVKYSVVWDKSYRFAFM